MYNDILGETEKDDDGATSDSIIKAQKANIEAKQKMIEGLIKQVTSLERKLEDLECHYIANQEQIKKYFSISFGI